MPVIRLKQERGEYSCDLGFFEAGKKYEVNEPTAYYLVHAAKVADLLEAPPIDIPMPIIPGKQQAATTKITEPEISQQVEPEISQQVEPETTQLNIAIIRLGGMGDSLELAAIATAVKRKHPDSIVTLFVRDRKGFDVVNDNPAVDRVVISGNLKWSLFLKKLFNKNYDIIFDNRYVTRVYYKDEKKWAKEKEITDKLFEPYKNYYDDWPLKCNEIASKAKMTSLQLSLVTADLDSHARKGDIYIKLGLKDFNMLPLLDKAKYVTIHNGADMFRQTKCWATDKWAVIVTKLKGRGYKVVQLGESCEEKVRGAIDMTGRTNEKECAALIGMAEFHIDTEGGLIYIAKAVRTRCIVLFGPTPESFFGYYQNINIVTPIACKECWWTTDMWWRECPQGFSMPVKCMNQITPDMVIEGIGKIEKMEQKWVEYNKADIFSTKMTADDFSGASKMTADKMGEA